MLKIRNGAKWCEMEQNGDSGTGMSHIMFKGRGNVRSGTGELDRNITQSGYMYTFKETLSTPVGFMSRIVYDC